MANDGKVRPVSAEEWEEVREATWRLWEELVAKPPDPGATPDNRRYWRDSESAWPPDSAVHDGIVGRALQRGAAYTPPDLHDSRTRAILNKLVDEGLAEVEEFKVLNPSAARSIREPLKLYVRLLRARARRW